MVRLSRIYTKTGDDGTTGLGNGSRVAKTDPRVTAYGEVDEANAALGVCALHSHTLTTTGLGGGAGASYAHAIHRLLLNIQNDLFDVGADLCCPIDANERPGDRLRVTAAQTARLEEAIDEHNERLAPLDSFVLPGGGLLAAHLHIARTVVRRAERAVVSLIQASAQSAAQTNPETVRYLNRLSDLLFVLSRVANDDGRSDVKWVPGANR